MKKSNLILIVTISLATMNLLMAQKNAIRFNTGYAIGKVDNRYDFLYGQLPVGIATTVNNKINDNTPDDEYAIGVGYTRKINKRLSGGMDIGYAQLVQDFLLPANGNSYFLAHIDPFFWRDKSWYHIIQVSPQVQYLFTTGKFNFGVNLQAIGNVSFRKHIKAFNLIRNKTEYFSTEVYPGITFGYWRLHANIGYRALHWKYRDDAIANNGLNPDKYNPFKMKFTLSYDIYRW